MAELYADPHVRGRGVIVELDGTPMQGLVARLSRTPGALRWAGRPLGADSAAVRAEVAEATEGSGPGRPVDAG
jgi:crotonobetainyl-CoA:carnitine CoA-transferase CaiB-like acyl-CoA transferase